VKGLQVLRRSSRAKNGSGAHADFLSQHRGLHGRAGPRDRWKVGEGKAGAGGQARVNSAGAVSLTISSSRVR
jgi:hypothetical protein